MIIIEISFNKNFLKILLRNFFRFFLDLIIYNTIQYNTIGCTIKIFTASVIPRETQALAPLLWGEVLVLEGSLLGFDYMFFLY